MPDGSVLQKWQMSGEIKALPAGKILLSKFQTLTSSTVEIISLTFLKDLTVTAIVVT